MKVYLKFLGLVIFYFVLFIFLVGTFSLVPDRLSDFLKGLAGTAGIR